MFAPKKSFRAVFNLKRLFNFRVIWNNLEKGKIRVKWQFSGLFFDFRVILTIEGYLLKITLKDS